jgi:hypothetical protein
MSNFQFKNLIETGRVNSIGSSSILCHKELRPMTSAIIEKALVGGGKTRKQLLKELEKGQEKDQIIEFEKNLYGNIGKISHFNSGFTINGNQVHKVVNNVYIDGKFATVENPKPVTFFKKSKSVQSALLKEGKKTIISINKSKTI